MWSASDLDLDVGVLGGVVELRLSKGVVVWGLEFRVMPIPQ